MLSGVREAAQTARQWLAFVRALPSVVLLRLSTVSGVSARAWRNVLVTAFVGIVASVVTLLVLRRSDGSEPRAAAVEAEVAA